MRYDHFDMLPERAFQKIGGRMTLEGGKGGGGSMPSPDPNIGIAQREMSALAKEEYQFFKNSVWPQMSAESARQTEAGIKTQEQQYKIGEKQLSLADQYENRMRTKFYPMQDQMIQEAKQYSAEGEQARQGALAIGDVRSQFANTKIQNDMQMASYGISPTSGRFAGMANANQVMEAATGAAAATKARSAAEQLGWAKRMDAIGLGQGLPGNQATSVGLGLNAGTSSLAAGNTGLNAYGALGASAAQGFGGAMQGWNNVGQLGVQNYNAQVNAWGQQQQANAANNAAFGSTLGSLAGAGAFLGGQAITKYSDRRLKDNIQYIGDLDSGLKVYSFEYKDEFKDHPDCGHGTFIGVMADEVEEVIPEAVFTMDNGYKAVNYELVR